MPRSNEEASVMQSSKTVVDSVVGKLDADKVEREKRRNNVVVLVDEMISVYRSNESFSCVSRVSTRQAFLA